MPLYKADGGFLGYIGSGIDVTERKKDQEALTIVARFPFENPAPVFRVDADGTVQFSNPAANRLIEGLPSSEADRVPHSITSEVGVAPKSGIRREIELQCGERRYSFVVAPISEYSYANLYGFDVTEPKAAEDALREADRRKDEFIGLLSHEVRNPLASLCGTIGNENSFGSC